MFEVPYEKMICDSDYGDGGINFYNDYFEWNNRSNGEGFKVYYKDIKDVKIISGLKKKVIVTLNDGEVKNLYLYKAETLRSLLYQAVKRVNGEATKEDSVIDVEPEPVNHEEEDVISQLERLAKLHESGALNDEEFALAKKKVLK